MQGLETEREFSVLMVFPWQQLLRNIVIGISLASGIVALHRAIKSLIRLLFGTCLPIQLPPIVRKLSIDLLVSTFHQRLEKLRPPCNRNA